VGVDGVAVSDLEGVDGELNGRNEVRVNGDPNGDLHDDGCFLRDLIVDFILDFIVDIMMRNTSQPHWDLV
jgi:hypothetical protein